MLGVNQNQVDECFNLYFHWFNIIHELSHILASNNGVPRRNNLVEKETMVNRIAASFLREFGDIDSYKRLQLIVDNAQEQLESPIPVSASFDEYFSDYKGEDDRDMAKYAFLQLTLARKALHSTEGIYDVLSHYRITNVRKVEKNKTCSVKNIDAQHTIDEASAILGEMWLIVPKVTVIYCNNPLIHCAPKSR